MNIMELDACQTLGYICAAVAVVAGYFTWINRNGGDGDGTE